MGNAVQGRAGVRQAHLESGLLETHRANPRLSFLPPSIFSHHCDLVIYHHLEDEPRDFLDSLNLR